MSYYLELQFCPEYKQLLDANASEYKKEVQSHINSCKVICSLIASQNKTTLEQANLSYFEYLVNSWAEVMDRKSFVDERFSHHMKRDVIAPSISFGTYAMELHEREDEGDEDEDDQGIKANQDQGMNESDVLNTMKSNGAVELRELNHGVQTTI